MQHHHMYDMSTPTNPDHLADITAGVRSPAVLEVDHDTWEHEGGALTGPRVNLRSYEQIVEKVSEVPSEVKKPERPEYIAGSRTDPYGSRFSWGPVLEVHQIGPYTIVEYLEDTSTYDSPAAWARHGRTLWHVYIDGKNAGMSALSLDAALAGAIAFRRDGANSTAGDYFMRMVGGGD